MDLSPTIRPSASGIGRSFFARVVYDDRWKISTQLTDVDLDIRCKLDGTERPSVVAVFQHETGRSFMYQRVSWNESTFVAKQNTIFGCSTISEQASLMKI